MLEEFIDYIQKIFPSIDPYIQEKTKNAIKIFHISEDKLCWLNSTPYEYLAQGDILDNIPFFKINRQGSIEVFKTKGILLSNTCSASRDESIVFAPLLNLKKLGLNNINDVKKNLYYRLMYIPTTRYQEFVIDFSLMNTFNREFINDRIKKNEIVKEVSLNQMGYYLLIAKLTICFMRPEDSTVQLTRRDNFYNINKLN